MFKNTALLTAVAGLAFAGAANAGTLDFNNAPAVGAEDSANLTGGSTLKWFNDVEHDAGQTFTANATGNLVSFSTQIGPTNSNEADAPPESILLRFGTVSGTPGVDWVFTDVHSETVTWTTDMVGGDWLTWNFDTAQAVTAGTEYAVITDAQAMGAWQNGIPSLARSTNGAAYAGGHMINRGNANTGADLVFIADIEVIPEPSSLALLGLGGLMIARRRKG